MLRISYHKSEIEDVQVLDNDVIVVIISCIEFPKIFCEINHLCQLPNLFSDKTIL